MQSAMELSMQTEDADIRERITRFTNSLRESGVDPSLLLFLQLPVRLTEGKEGLDYVRCKAIEMGIPLNKPCVYKIVENEIKETGIQRFGLGVAVVVR